MSMSTFQKLTLVTCLVLCVALLLPKMLLSRGKKDAAQTEASPGRFPPMVHRQMAPDSQGQRAAGLQFSRSHNTEAIARAKGGGTGAGTGGKSNLAGQIIPIYGFGILMYILYILFKITSKGNAKPTESKFSSVRSENLKRKITDFELTQLQEKLKETEMVMEKIVSKASHSPERVRGVSADQEETLLLQLREITRVMQEGRLVEGVAPEKKAEDWEGFPEESHDCWEEPFCGCHNAQQHSPEEEAERTVVGEAYQEDGVADQKEDGAYQEEAVPEQEEDGAFQEEAVPEQEEGRAYQEESVAYWDLGTSYQEESGVVLEQDCSLDDRERSGKAVDMKTEGKGAVGAKGNVSVIKEEYIREEKQGRGMGQLGVNTYKTSGGEPELKTSTILEPEQEDSVNRPKETSTSSTRVRRRHKKKRTHSANFTD